MASKTWRDEMTTNGGSATVADDPSAVRAESPIESYGEGLNAPLDQRGLELVAAWNETSDSRLVKGCP